MILEKGKEYTCGKDDPFYFTLNEMYSTCIDVKVYDKKDNILVYDSFFIDEMDFSKIIPYNRMEKGQFVMF